MNITDKFSKQIETLYGNDVGILKKQFDRYNKLYEKYSNHFSDDDHFLFSTPGRTEIGGNHTDHNLGRVIAGSVNLDSIAIVSKNNSQNIIFYSDIFNEPFEININELEIVEEEVGTTNSLVRGIAARFLQLGYKLGGFNGMMTSDVLLGSGLSSSASVEVLIGTIFNTLFNNGNIENEELALIGQYAENNYFGKPCGLMDQMACAVGGVIAIDFLNPEKPDVKKVNFDFETHGYKLLIVDTDSDHEDLTEDYASIPKEMKAVAKLLNKNACREINLDMFLKNIKIIREAVGDRAALRVFHFINENDRVVKQINALQENNIPQFMRHINDSGNSSFKWLQNIYSSKTVQMQGVSIALALSEMFINEINEGACRVHGGGFAGTIQVFLPIQYVDEYKSFMENILGSGKVMILNIRSTGSVCLNNL